MKHLKFLLMSMALFVGLQAQAVRSTVTAGSLSSLVSGTICVKLDCSRMQIGGLSETHFLEAKGHDAESQAEWSADVRRTMLLKFSTSLYNIFAKYNWGMQLLDSPQAQYTATVLLCNFSTKGDLQAETTITETATGNQIAKIKLYGKGGHFGTTENLMGDSCKSAGENLGMLIVGQ